jgi:ribulose-phosphate 3-epimerase
LDISNFLPNTLPKIHRVREMIEQINSGFDLEVDGGIDAETAPLAAAAGANVLVSGTAVFGENEGVSTAMDRLRASIKQSQKTASGGQVRRSSTGPPWGR